MSYKNTREKLTRVGQFFIKVINGMLSFKSFVVFRESPALKSGTLLDGDHTWSRKI